MGLQGSPSGPGLNGGHTVQNVEDRGETMGATEGSGSPLSEGWFNQALISSEET